MEEAVSMQAWNSHYDAQREFNRRRHSRVCTETMMKTFRCMKKSHGVKSECKELLEAVHQCRNPDMSTLQRKPTAIAATAAAAATTA